MRRMRATALVAAAACLSLTAGLVVPAVSRGRAGGLGTAQGAPPHGKRHASTARFQTDSQCLATPDVATPCYDPAQIQTAYDVAPLHAQGITGAGTTIAVVVPFGSPTIRSDLAHFDAKFGLMAPPTFRVVHPSGAVPRVDPRTATVAGWAEETTLDVEWAHALAPGAGILLVETPVSETEGTVGFPQIMAAERDVVDHHMATVISESFGANEQTFSSPQAVESMGATFVDAAEKGVTVVAASGDTGATDEKTPTGSAYSATPTVTWPASDPLVTSVGGTQLSLDAAGHRTAPDQAWNDTYDKSVDEQVFGTAEPEPDATGGGVSSIFGRPPYQDGVASVVGGGRGVPDISMSGACSAPVDTYQGFRGPTPPGWYHECGTSESAPLFAAVVALADQEAGHSLGLVDPAIYAMAQAGAPGIVDVTRGDNTVSFSVRGKTETVQGYSAGPGYDLVTGLGTLDAALFVPELVHEVAALGAAATDEAISDAVAAAPSPLRELSRRQLSG